jgi:hypothetical protein
VRAPKKITRRTTRKEMAALVARALRDASIDAVLVGGSVAAIYTGERYATEDLDFVSYKPLKTIAPVMERLGFKMVGNRAVHPNSALYVQFCAPPLAIGREPVSPVKLKTAYGTLDILSPTDCVLDRLMKFYHWGDEQGLEQAILVAKIRNVDLARARELSTREGKLDQFKFFEAELRRARASRPRR